jgi:multimeric flavodoxin WrbA
MKNEKKLLVFINGSPKLKAENSASELLINMGQEAMSSGELEFYKVHVRESLNRKNTDEDFAMMQKADALIFAFPLYIYCLPGILIRYLQDFHQYLREQGGFHKKVKVYAVVNCGFPEAFINEEAVRVVKSFCRQTGADFGFETMIGSGGMLFGGLETPFMKQMKEDLMAAYERMKAAILYGQKDSGEAIMAQAKIPMRLYYFMGNRGWYSEAKKHGLKKKDLYRRPYLKEERT